MEEATHSQLVRFGPFEVNLRTGELRKQGIFIRLPEQAFSILALLVEHSGELVTREQIARKLWGENTFVDFDQSIGAAIGRLRRALNDSASTPRYIETVRQRGFRLLMPVIPVDVADRPVTAPLPRRQMPLASLAGAVLLLLIAGFGLMRRTGHNPPIAPIRSLAVLPFHVIKAKESDQYMELGIADALITNLSHLRRVSVRPTSAVRKYSSRNAVALNAGRELGVDAVLEGTIQTVDGQMRVTVQLVRTADGQPFWAQKFDQSFNGILDAEDTIARRVAAAIVNELTAPERQEVEKRYTASPLAFEAYQKGRFLWNQRTPDSLRRATGFFEEAIQHDPGYALAYVGLADTLTVMNLYSGLQRRLPFERAKKAVDNALSLDPLLAEAYATSSYVKLYYDWDWEGAERAARRAIELNPNYASAHQWLAELLFYLGRFVESIAEMEQSHRIDPQSVVISLQLASPYFYSHRCPEAIPKIREAMKLDPKFPLSIYMLGSCQMQTGQLEEAVREFRKIEDAPFGQAGLAVALARSGNEREARAILTRLRVATDRGAASPFLVARVYANLGEPAQAVSWLWRSVGQRDERIVYLKVDPQFDPIRQYPAFQAVLRKLRLDQVSQ